MGFFLHPRGPNAISSTSVRPRKGSTVRRMQRGANCILLGNFWKITAEKSVTRKSFLSLSLSWIRPSETEWKTLLRDTAVNCKFFGTHVSLARTMSRLSSAFVHGSFGAGERGREEKVFKNSMNMLKTGSHPPSHFGPSFFSSLKYSKAE